jgi:hypothetical protein
MRKGRVTLMFRDNASGKHEFPLVYIENLQNLGHLQITNLSALSLKYYPQTTRG